MADEIFELFEGDFMDKDWNHLKELLVPHELDVHCPFCGSGWVKTNGSGFYRCKGGCRHEFFLAPKKEGEQMPAIPFKDIKYGGYDSGEVVK